MATVADHASDKDSSATEDISQGDLSMPKMNESWYGKPVEEVDPLVFDDTFCVISKKMQRNFIYRYSCSKSLWLMGPLNPIRKMAILITTHAWFDLLMMIVLLANSITLAMITNKFEPGTKDTKIYSDAFVVIERIEYGFLGVYTFELVFKVIAKGFMLNKYSYLRNRWNILDLVVVVSGYGIIFKDMVSGHGSKQDNELDFLRTFRILRVVKTISILPGLRLMINALLSSVVRLMEAMGLIMICLIIFALFAVEMFQGVLRQKCVVNKGGPADPDRLINQKLEDVQDPDERDRLWTEWVTDWRNWKRRDFPQNEPTQCGNGSTTRQCGTGYTCIGKLGENPDDGWTSFDHFFASMLSTFQLITADYWERVYDVVVSTVGIWSLFFFTIIIFVGSYYLLNLLLAVVTLSYEHESTLLGQTNLSAQDKLGLYRRQSNFSFDELSKLNICKVTHMKKRTKSEQIKLREYATRLQFANREGDEDKENVHLEDAVCNLLAMNLQSLKEAEEDTRKPSFVSVSGLSNDPKNRKNTVTGGTSVELKTVGEEGEESSSHATSDVEVESTPHAHTRALVVLRTGLCSRLQDVLRPMVEHRYFETFIIICIILNTVILAMEHAFMSKVFEQTLRLSNLIFMGIFTLECVLKLLALQRDYFKSGWNIFDLLIVIMSYADFGVSLSSRGGSGLSVLRSFRLLRVFKLARSWLTMKVLLNIIFASFADLGNLTILLLIIIYIFAVMGMQTVGEQYNNGAFDAVNNPLHFPRWNWQHFWYAFMMVFRVLCGEWIEPLWECLQAQSFYIEDKQANAFSAYFKCFAIFLPILIVGNFIVFNLFLAMLLNSFDTEELNAQREREMEASGRTEKMKNIVSLLLKQKEKEDADEEGGEGEDNQTMADQSMVTGSGSPPKLDSKSTAQDKTSGARRVPESEARKRWKRAINRIILYLRIDVAELAIARADNKLKQKNQMTNRFFLRNPGARGAADPLQHAATPESSDEVTEVSVARDCFPCKCAPRRKRKTILTDNPWTFCRRWSVVVVSHPVFETTIIILIFASSILLCFEDIHLEEQPSLRYNLCIANMVFTVAFLIEMILKWFAIGLWGYFTSFWTILDGFIVLVSLISGYFDLTVGTCFGKVAASAANERKHSLGSLKALRTLRALRPLRAISRWQGMKIVVNSLIHAIPAIFNVLLVCLLLWLIFSIMGVQFFKGQFYRCVDDQGNTMDSRVVPNKDVCCAKADSHGYSWVNQISNFDNVFEGYLSLFQIATFEGWMELMGSAVDATGVDKQPRIDNQIQYYAFFVIFIIIGSFFALELFTGVIIDNFNMLKKKYEGSVLETHLTPSQRNYVITMKNLRRRLPQKIIQKPKGKFRAYFYYLALSRKLEVFILIMIFMNLLIEAFETYDSGKLRIHMLAALKSFFTVIYVLEAIVKIYGLGIHYFTIPRNVYDLVLVLASLMDVFLTTDLSVVFPLPPTMLRIVRTFRVGRILRTVKAAAGFRKLLFALTISLPALLNIGALLALITFIYAILGMNLFGRAPEKWSINEVFSFRTFGSSNLMLLRLMTLAGWNEVLDSLTYIEPVCGNYRHLECGLPGEPECPSRFLVVLYIVSYLLLTNQIMINLFIAIILENYVEATNEEEIGIVEDDLALFYIRWSRYDPFATQFIDFKDLPEFLDSLNPPLQVPRPNTLALVAFNLPIARGNKIHCLDILHALIQRAIGPIDNSVEFRKLIHGMERKFDEQFPNRGLLDIVSSTRRWKLEYNAAVIIQRAFRSKRARRMSTKIAEKKEPVAVEGDDHGGYGHMMKRTGNIAKKQIPAVAVVGDKKKKDITEKKLARKKSISKSKK